MNNRTPSNARVEIAMIVSIVIRETGSFIKYAKVDTETRVLKPALNGPS
jgi:hypothetical protein